MTRRSPKLCPPLRFVCEKHGTDPAQGATCRALRVDDGEEAGRIELEAVEDTPDLLQVSFVRAYDEKGKQPARCGVGTRLYEHALAYACSSGLRLSSDVMRTRFSEKFWKKQVTKGRAECIRRRRGEPHGADMLDENFGATGKRWRCRRYAIKACPERIDLSGASKKIDWREPLVRKRRRKA